MIVVSDTTPLSELAKVGHLNLLKSIFGEVIIPQEVYDEVTTGIHPAASAVPLVDWIIVRSVSNSYKVSTLQRQTGLDLGECAAIVLAEELGAERILIDELAARREALSRNLLVVGTLGILINAKARKLIPNVKEVLDAMIRNGKRVGQKLYAEILETAGES